MRNVFLILSTVFFCTHLLFSQNYETDLMGQLDGDTIAVVANTTNSIGDIIIGSRVRGAVDLDPGEGITLTPEDVQSSFMITTYDRTGLLKENIFMVSNGSVSLVDLDVDSEGSIYITGNFSGTVDFDPSESVFELSAPGDSEVFVAKYTDNTFQWAKKIGETNFFQFPGQIIISNNRIIVPLIFSGIVDFDPGPGVTSLNGDVDQAILELDLDGNFLWAAVLVDAFIVDAHADEAGNLFLGGQFRGTVNFDFLGTDTREALGNSSDSFVAKYNATHALEWVNTFGSSTATESTCELATNSDGDLMSIANIGGAVKLPNGVFIGEDRLALIKYSETGVMETALDLMDPLESNITDMISTEGQVHFLGRFGTTVDVDFSENEILFDPEPNKFNSFLVSTDNDGVHIASGIIAGLDQQNSNLSADQEGRLVLAHTFRSNGKLLFGSNEEVTINGEENLIFERLGVITQIDNDMDGFNADVDCDDKNPDVNPNGVEIPNNGIDEDCDGEDLMTSSTSQIGTSTVEIFPNPVSENLNIIIEGENNFIGELFDIHGRLISRGSFGSVSNIVEMEYLDSGVYFLEIFSSENKSMRKTEKLIKL